jgi:LacI family transcriptional regulator
VTTIRDVAQAAGVSVATVSRAFNNSGPVREQTRGRIVEAAERLRYVPNGAARTLSTRRTQTIGVLLPDLYGEFFSEVIRGIDRVVQGEGWHLLMSSSHAGRESIVTALGAMRGRVDGLLVMSPDLDTRTLSANLPERLPAVLINCEPGGRRYDSINIDNYTGAYAVTEYLIRLGHRRIALLGGPDRNHDARERLRGSIAALGAAGLDCPAALRASGDFSEASGHAAAIHFLSVYEPPTAIVAANDSMAIGAVSALREHGVSVPREVSVAGFDDIPIARYLDPSLTTVRVSIPTLGERAAQRLFEVLKQGGQERVQELLPTELVVRKSCAAVGKVVRDAPRPANTFQNQEVVP